MRINHEHPVRKLGGKPAYAAPKSDTYTCQRCGLSRKWNPSRDATRPELCRDCR